MVLALFNCFRSGSLYSEIIFTGGKKHQIYHSAPEGHNKKIRPLSQLEFPMWPTLAQFREIQKCRHFTHEITRL